MENWGIGKTLLRVCSAYLALCAGATAVASVIFVEIGSKKNHWETDLRTTTITGPEEA
jgi:hypothetical protein